MESRNDIFEELDGCIENHERVISSLYLGKDLAMIRDIFYKFKESWDGVDRLNLYDGGVARIGKLVDRVARAKRNLWKQHNFPYRKEVLVEAYRFHEDLVKVRKFMVENWEAVEKDGGFSLDKRAR